MKKRIVAGLVALLLLLTPLGGCAARESGERPLRVVVTVFPVYDWLRNVLGQRLDQVELTLLMDQGTDLHSFQPTAEDMIRVSACDLFVYVGGESDRWVEDALSEAANPRQRSLNLMEALGDLRREEERKEGMEAEDEEEDGGPAYDEHIWLSLKNARVLTDALADALAALDPDHAAIYGENARAYGEKLTALDEAYAAAAAAGRCRTLLFADRFPFLYLTRDYGLDYYAAFSGCSAETEASFATVIFLAEKLRELALPAVLSIESGDGRLARTVLENAGVPAELLVLDSLQSVTGEELRAGASYLGTMEENLEILRKALG